MILALECLATCAIFTLIFVGLTLKNKLAFFREYSPAVQKRYMELHPEFQMPEEKMTPGLICAKLCMCLFFLTILTGMAWLAGADTFLKGFGYSYLIWSVVNLFDATVLDLGVFMFWKKVRLPGTEDMDEAYRQNVWPSLKGGLYGIAIGLPVCLLCGWILTMI